jgi:hypothetical protein
MTSLVLGWALPFLACARSSNQFADPSEVEGLPQITGSLPSIRRVRS